MNRESNMLRKRSSSVQSLMNICLGNRTFLKQLVKSRNQQVSLIEQDLFFLPKPCLKTLYYCLVYPYLHYCIIVWGSTNKTNLRRLVSLQKRVIRIISKSTFDSHSDPIFKDLELLKLSDIRQLELGKLMFSLSHFFFAFKVQQLFFFKQTSPQLCHQTRERFSPVEQTFVNFLSVSKDLLIITLQKMILKKNLVLSTYSK